MQHFEGLREEGEIKSRYKELAKRHHPDLGGCKVMMQQINAQYEQVMRGHYQRAGKSITEIDELLEKDEVLRNKLNEILAIDDLIIEVCGSWIWVTGDTKPYKEKLKEAKFMWSQGKLAWYWRADDKRARFKHKHEPLNLDMIRYRHGSFQIRSEKRAAIA